MPEFAEVWILGEALRRVLSLSTSEVFSHGKMLFLHKEGKLVQLTFGLHGGVTLEGDEVTHVKRTAISGGWKKVCESDLPTSTCVMKLDADGWNEIKKKWSKKRKQIGALLLEQDSLAGIGLAYASESLGKADIHPTRHANSLTDVEWKVLESALFSVREDVSSRYEEHIRGMDERELRVFVHDWFENLYKVRCLEVYKGKNTIRVLSGGRQYYVKQ